MKKNNLIILLSLVISLFTLSCGKDNAAPTAAGSREVKYEITGNYAGTFTLVATTNNDNFEILEITKLPWELSFTAKSSITQIIIQGTGQGGQTRQKATLKTFVGGKEVATGTGTALSSGIISITNSLYRL